MSMSHPNQMLFVHENLHDRLKLKFRFYCWHIAAFREIIDFNRMWDSKWNKYKPL